MTNRNNSNTIGKSTNIAPAAKPFPASADPLTPPEKLKRIGLGICFGLAGLAIVLVFFTLLFQPGWLIKALTYMGLAFLGIFLVLIVHRIGFIRGKDEAKEREFVKHQTELKKLTADHQREIELLKAQHTKELGTAYQQGVEKSSKDFFKTNNMASHFVGQLEEELRAEQKANEALRARNTQLEQENAQLLQTKAELVEALPADDSGVAATA